MFMGHQRHVNFGFLTVQPIHHSKKSRVDNEPYRRGRNPSIAMSSDHELISLPNPMIGFGLPDGTGLRTERPDPIPSVARGPPYFYYENVAMAPKGVWATISRELYNIRPEFVDSMYFCAAMRNRTQRPYSGRWCEQNRQIQIFGKLISGTQQFYNLSSSVLVLKSKTCFCV